jgi:hypothetical protein
LVLFEEQVVLAQIIHANAQLCWVHMNCVAYRKYRLLFITRRVSFDVGPLSAEGTAGDSLGFASQAITCRRVATLD